MVAGSGISVGSSVSTTSSPAISTTVTAGQSFSANISYLVRWGIPNNSETADRVYIADAASASNGQYQVIGVLVSPTALTAGETAPLFSEGSYTIASGDATFLNTQVGLPVYLTNDSSGSFTLTPSIIPGDVQIQVGIVQSTTQVWVSLKDIGEIVPVPQYDEIIYYPSGLSASTSILIPVNSRNSNVQETYSATGGDLEVYVNDLFNLQQTTVNPAADWYSVDSTHIAFTYDLTNDTIVHFRKNPLSSGVLTGSGGGGGSETLQQAYNNGSTITTTSGNPFTVNGTATKVAVFTGDIEVTGVVDPTGIQFTPQSSNPLGAGQQGLWVDNSGNLQQQGVSSATNITEVINSVIAGTAQTTITNTYSNLSGSDIPQFSPVYMSGSGLIDLADGTNSGKFQVIGVTTQDIENTSSGLVAFTGYLPTSAFAVGTYVYLGLTPGTLTTTAPSVGGGYPSGFNIIKIGISDGTNLVLQIQYIWYSLIIIEENYYGKN